MATGVSAASGGFVMTDEHMTRLFTWAVNRLGAAVLWSLLAAFLCSIAGAFLGAGDGSSGAWALALGSLGSLFGFALPLACATAPWPHAMMMEPVDEAQRSPDAAL